LKSRRLFKARRNVIVFLTGDLELPFATYNPELLATLNPQIDREIVRATSGARVPSTA
jgi:hypothetical protein